MFIRPERISIDSHTHIGERTYFRGAGVITIGKWCQIAANVIIVTTNHNINGKLYYNNVNMQDVTIGDNVWLGAGAMIMPGVSIGNNSVVAAGAVVTKDVPPNTLVGGVPAKKLKDLNDVFASSECPQL